MLLPPQPSTLRPALNQVRDYLPPLTMCPGNAIVHSLADADAALPGKPQVGAYVPPHHAINPFRCRSCTLICPRGKGATWLYIVASL
jgi:hypothetical protein